MRSRIFFILFFCWVITLHAQDTINRKDADGKKSGYWIKKDSVGQKIYEGRFVRDIPDGEFKYYYPEGQLKALSTISDNGNRAGTVTYYKNGRKMAAGNYFDEKKEGLWKFYSQYEDVIVSEETYKDGKKDGISRTFYADGVVAEIMTWKDGIREGNWEQYYTDGKLKLKCAFAADQKEGPILTFHLNGKPWLTGKYVNGNPDGTWTYLSERGELEMKEYYRNGTLLKTEEFGSTEKK